MSLHLSDPDLTFAPGHKLLAQLDAAAGLPLRWNDIKCWLRVDVIVVVQIKVE